MYVRVQICSFFTLSCCVCVCGGGGGGGEGGVHACVFVHLFARLFETVLCVNVFVCLPRFLSLLAVCLLVCL